MKRFLDRVGVAQQVLDLIPEIVHTCQVCREWAKPGPSNACSVDLPDTFNLQVECDLVFIHKFIVFHMLDRCIRWEAAQVIPDKSAPTLMKAIDTTWITIHGPPKELICDLETGIVGSDQTTEFLARKGIKLHPRGKDQHATYAERRGALLRDVIHRVEGQLHEEGIVGVPFECTLAEAVFCGNAMLTVGGSTPYNGLYGRVPRILPSIDQVDDPGDAKRLSPGLISHANRLREISVQAMIEGSARARLGRALNTRTTMAGQKLNLHVGDEVDVYRAPPNKDTSGWQGPAEVIDISRVTRGIVSVRWQSKVLEVQIPHIRRHLHFLALLSTMANTLDEGLSYASAFDNVWKHIKEVVEQLKVGSHVQVGHCYHDGRWLLTSNNVKFPKLMSAAKFYAENHLQLTNVVAARAGRGIRELSALQGFSRSTIILWRPGATYTRIIELEADTRYRMY